jgi:hypothetical protein
VTGTDTEGVAIAGSERDASAGSDDGFGIPQPPRRVRQDDDAAAGAGSGDRAGLGATGCAAGDGIGSTTGFFLKKLNMLGRKNAP